jgi:hypothetical protein
LGEQQAACCGDHWSVAAVAVEDHPLPATPSKMSKKRIAPKQIQITITITGVTV